MAEVMRTKLTFGSLPTGKSNPSSIAVSVVCNMAAIGVLLGVTATARHTIAVQKYNAVTLNYPPRVPLPPPPHMRSNPPNIK